MAKLRLLLRGPFSLYTDLVLHRLRVRVAEVLSFLLTLEVPENTRELAGRIVNCSF